VHPNFICCQRLIRERSVVLVLPAYASSISSSQREPSSSVNALNGYAYPSASTLAKLLYFPVDDSRTGRQSILVREAGRRTITPTASATIVTEAPSMIVHRLIVRSGRASDPHVTTSHASREAAPGSPRIVPHGRMARRASAATARAPTRARRVPSAGATIALDVRRAPMRKLLLFTMCVASACTDAHLSPCGEGAAPGPAGSQAVVK